MRRSINSLYHKFDFFRPLCLSFAGVLCSARLDLSIQVFFYSSTHHQLIFIPVDSGSFPEQTIFLLLHVVVNHEITVFDFS